MKLWQQIFRYLGLITYLGVLVATSIFLGYLGGGFLDNLFGVAMVFTMIGTVVGAISGFYLLYKTAINFVNREDNRG
jgi:F0F1-type ATP synthase assembly protein I